MHTCILKFAGVVQHVVYFLCPALQYRFTGFHVPVSAAPDFDEHARADCSYLILDGGLELR